MSFGDSRSWLLLDLQRRPRPWKLRVQHWSGEQEFLEYRDERALRVCIESAVERSNAWAESEQVPLPVFFRRTQALELEARLRRGLSAQLKHRRIMLIPTARREFRVRPALSLPFEVALIGDIDARVADPLRSQHWLYTPAAGNHGLRIERLEFASWKYRRAAPALEIAVTDAATALKILRGSKFGEWPPRRPRVLFTLGSKRELASFKRRSLPVGMNLVLAPLANNIGAAGLFLLELTLGLVHDKALHFCVATAASTQSLAAAQRPSLIADPGSNWALSLSDAYRALRRRAEFTIETARALELAESRPPGPLPPRYFVPELRLSERALNLDTMLMSMQPTFAHETDGLVPSAQVAAELSELEEVVQRVQTQSFDEALPTISERGRHVSMSMHRTRPGSGPFHPSDPTAVLPNTALGINRRYQLLVRIGAPLSNDLVSGHRQPIDLTLPESRRGHVLEVSVFGLDFKVEGAPVLQLLLPPRGPTELAEFMVRAPPRPGRARMRIAITYLDQLLQSYVVTCQVRDQEVAAAPPDDYLHARMEFSSSESFRNLDATKSRAATFIVNADPNGETNIGIKRTLHAVDLRFDDQQMSRVLAESRQLLGQAAVDDVTFREPPAVGVQAELQRARAFEKLVKSLVMLGARIHSDLAATGAETRKLLRDIRDGDDLIVEIVEVKRGGSLPWLLIYDGVPGKNTIADMEHWPVCTGFVDGASCGHEYADTQDQICLRRLWGVRHRIDCRLGQPSNPARSRDAPVRIGGGARTPIGIGIGKQSSQHLRPRCALDEIDCLKDVYDKPQDIYQQLSNAVRPRVIAVLGHLDIVQPPGSQLARSTTIDLEPQLLSDTGLIQRIQNDGDWMEPLSVVLLLACSSNHLPAAALTSLVDTFLGAPASAVVGTETVVYPRLCARFVQLFFESMSRPGCSFGEAMKDTRLKLLSQLNPLGLTFIGWGNADLMLNEPPAVHDQNP